MKRKMWNKLPKHKSLFGSKHQGLPIIQPYGDDVVIYSNNKRDIQEIIDTMWKQLKEIAIKKYEVNV